MVIFAAAEFRFVFTLAHRRHFHSCFYHGDQPQQRKRCALAYVQKYGTDQRSFLRRGTEAKFTVKCDV